MTTEQKTAELNRMRAELAQLGITAPTSNQHAHQHTANCQHGHSHDSQHGHSHSHGGGGGGGGGDGAHAHRHGPNCAHGHSHAPPSAGHPHVHGPNCAHGVSPQQMEALNKVREKQVAMKAQLQQKKAPSPTAVSSSLDKHQRHQAHDVDDDDDDETTTTTTRITATRMNTDIHTIMDTVMVTVKHITTVIDRQTCIAFSR